MDERRVGSTISPEQRRLVTKRLLTDLRALETMLDNGMIESDVRRIGAEQELCLIGKGSRPVGVALDILDAVGDSHFTTELGKFNLEINLDPQIFGGDCLSRMEAQLTALLSKGRAAAARCGADLVMTGILPTIRKSDLGLDNMTPMPRYYALNDAVSQLRGGDHTISIKGIDELLIRHDNIMLESCNTSFQTHFQVGANEFANLYNVAQVVAAPVLAAATNSPLLFGRRLWSETRIALFQQAIDTRSASPHMRVSTPRVSFGREWVHHSVTELYKDDITRFKLLIGTELDEDPLELLEKGETPRLNALCLHNGTVYRWNRPCYGVTDGKPHLRIENRYLPSGPTPVDEMANAAFWFGLITALASAHADVTRVMEFDEALNNFVAAARLGLGAELTWLEGRKAPVRDLIRAELLPAARDGLVRKSLASGDIDRYLGIIEERVERNATGSHWMLSSLAAMKDRGTQGERLSALTAALARHQWDGTPVARWEPAQLDDAGGWKHNYVQVEQMMTTDLFTVHQDDPVDLVASLMHWRKIRHVPVEDDRNRLVGLVSYRTLLKLVAAGELDGQDAPAAVSDIMKRDPVTVEPEVSTLDAIAIMRNHRIGCLPVVKNGQLVGIITERDFMNIASRLLEARLAE